MKFPVPMEAWKYGDPLQIGDALLKRTARLKKAKASKLKAKASARAKKDGFYRQSKSIHFKELVRIAKSGGLRA
jgi:hypothetical protein